MSKVVNAFGQLSVLIDTPENQNWVIGVNFSDFLIKGKEISLEIALSPVPSETYNRKTPPIQIFPFFHFFGNY